MRKVFKQVVCVCITLTTIFSLVGCVERFIGDETDYSTGEVLTPEMIESIFEAISTPVTERYPTETREDGRVLLYWLEGGSVWHASLNCGSIAKASQEKLRSGDIAEAISAGKDRGCKICTEGLEFDTYDFTVTESSAENTNEITREKYPKNYDLNGNLIVYWLKNGSVWHVSRECSSLSKSSEADINSGTEQDAQASGKERACKICSDDDQK